MPAKARSREKPVKSSALKVRSKLLEAGRKAFANKGLGGVSLREDILERAGVSVGSFYHQFADKADLLVEILRCDGEQILEAMKRSGDFGESDPVERGRRLLNELFDMADRRGEFTKIFIREYHSDSPEVRRQIRKHQDRTIADLRTYYQALRDATGLPLDVDGIATLIAVQILALVNYYLEFSKRRRKAIRDKLIENTMQLLVGGVLAVRTTHVVPTTEQLREIHQS